MNSIYFKFQSLPKFACLNDLITNLYFYVDEFFQNVNCFFLRFLTIFSKV